MGDYVYAWMRRFNWWVGEWMGGLVGRLIYVVFADVRLVRWLVGLGGG